MNNLKAILYDTIVISSGGSYISEHGTDRGDLKDIVKGTNLQE